LNKKKIRKRKENEIGERKGEKTKKTKNKQQLKRKAKK
jgi:hypothetical protein